jgi:hypothetical protein
MYVKHAADLGNVFRFEFESRFLDFRQPQVVAPDRAIEDARFQKEGVIWRLPPTFVRAA